MSEPPRSDPPPEAAETEDTTGPPPILLNEPDRTSGEAAPEPTPPPVPQAPPPISEEAARRAAEMPVEFTASASRLFTLSAVTGALTVLTLGLYRFWMKTRLRRFYWSAVRPGGLPLEYVGQPLEKLLGFLIAVVILAFYIGVVNLILMFASFSLLSNNFAAYAVSFVGVIPLWFYARYRARRYVLARTRWRGVRFGLEPGAWGYAWRALVHWLVTIVTLGLMWPRMTFHLEKYKTDRTWFGDRRFQQGGSWQMLYPGMIHPIIGTVLILVSVVSLSGQVTTPLNVGLSVALWGVGLIWLAAGSVHYRTRSLRLLTDHKSAGGVRFRSGLHTGRVLRIYGLGYFVVAVLSTIPLLLLGLVVDQLGLLNFNGTVNPNALPRGLLIALGVALYFFIFLSWSTLKHTFVTLPWWRHAATTLTLSGTPSIAAIRQRPRDEAEQAEGFAEALDVGAAI